MEDNNSFLLVDLKEDKAKKLAQVISNDSCRKILDYLTHKEKATETEIAEDLKLPLSTVHYNLKHLHKSGLVVADEFHYSQKGKEVNHYKLANKFIIIAPNNDSSFMDKLRKILPLGIFAVLASGAIQVFNHLKERSYGVNFAQEASLDVARAKVAPLMAENTAGNSTLTQAAVHEGSKILPSFSEPNTALWFLAGSVFIILIILIMNLIKRK